MLAALEPKDREFLQRLNRLGGGTIQEIGDDLGVTATAVRLRLNRLQGMGLIDREAVGEGRGRPCHYYSLSQNGLKELGENYAELAMTLWRAVRNLEPPELREQVMDQVRKELVRRYRNTVHGASLTERSRELREGLSHHGFDVDLEFSNELPVLKGNNCPYLELASSDSGICELEQAVFAEVLGAPVHLSQCQLEGGSCCEFQVGDQLQPKAALVE